MKVGARFWVPEGRRQAKTLKQAKTKRAKQVVGRLSLHEKGFGFVTSENGRDWFIPRHDIGEALHGDTVRVQFVEQGSSGRKVGKIVAIEKKQIEQLITVCVAEGRAQRMVPLGNVTVPMELLRGLPAEPIAEGTLVLWNRRKKGFAFDRVMGRFDDPECDEEIVLTESHIKRSFPDSVVENAEEMARADRFDASGREDFRQKVLFTVDGPDARDFDDAIHVIPSEAGFELGVHIADVSHFVTEGSALDTWASQVGNSTYLPHRAFPMLPDVLSSGLCSLVPNEDRYTLTVVMQLNKKGQVKSSHIRRSIIRSAQRLTYDQVQSIGVDRDEGIRQELSQIVDQVDSALELASILSKRRRRQGSLALDLGEVSIGLDDQHLIDEIKMSSGKQSHQMIEMFMVLANEVVAEYMTERGIGIPYRIHEPPKQDLLQNLAELMGARGFDTKELTKDPATGLNQLLASFKQLDAHKQKVYQVHILRSLKLAVYSPQNLGHFGLASECYAHFTSPIRRYADLVLHRRLTQALENPQLGSEHFDDSRLGQICDHISGTERQSAKAESQFVKLKTLRLLSEKVGDELEGVVTDIKTQGLFVELDNYWIDGLVLMDYLSDDIYEISERDRTLTGVVKGRAFSIGDRIKVRLERVDMIMRRMDLAIPGMEKTFKRRELGRRTDRNRSGKFKRR